MKYLSFLCPFSWQTDADGALAPIRDQELITAAYAGNTAPLLTVTNLSSSGGYSSDIAHAVPLTLIAGIGHWFIGSVDWALLGSLLLGSLPGIWLGSHASSRVPDRILRPILAAMLVLVGGKLISL